MSPGNRGCLGTLLVPLGCVSTQCRCRWAASAFPAGIHTAATAANTTTYHRRRRQDRLGRLTPVESELIMNKAADQAAQSEVP